MNAMDHVVAQYRDSLHSWISDASKDAQGFRHRFDPEGYTTNELNAMADEWCRRVEIAIQEQAVRDQEAIADFEESVSEYVAIGAKDRATAIRWMMGALDQHDQEYIAHDSGYFNFLHGLPYSYDFQVGAVRR
jgi:hypothetical protein